MGPINPTKVLTSKYKLDLKHYEHASLPPKAFQDLVRQVENIHGEMRKWTNGISGLRAVTYDGDRESLQDYRQIWLQQANAARKKDGTWAAVKLLIKRVLEWRGWIYRRRMAHPYEQWTNTRDSELIGMYNGQAPNVGIGLDFITKELTRRQEDRRIYSYEITQ